MEHRLASSEHTKPETGEQGTITAKRAEEGGGTHSEYDTQTRRKETGIAQITQRTHTRKRREKR